MKFSERSSRSLYICYIKTKARESEMFDDMKIFRQVHNGKVKYIPLVVYFAHGHARLCVMDNPVINWNIQIDIDLYACEIFRDLRSCHAFHC